MTNVLITLGSNIEPSKNYVKAVERIAEQSELTVKQSSPIYRSAAVGPDGQPLDQQPYHNGAIWLETALQIEELRAVLREIEKNIGRTRTADKFAARPIDIDIAFYGDSIMQTADYKVPDPDIIHFAHLAQPLADIAPDWIHPTHNQTLRQIANSLDDTNIEIQQQ